MLHEDKVDTLKMKGKIGALFRKIYTIKKNPVEILELKNIISKLEKFIV